MAFLMCFWCACACMLWFLDCLPLAALCSNKKGVNLWPNCNQNDGTFTIRIEVTCEGPAKQIPNRLSTQRRFRGINKFFVHFLVFAFVVVGFFIFFLLVGTQMFPKDFILFCLAKSASPTRKMFQANTHQSRVFDGTSLTQHTSFHFDCVID